MHKSKFKTTWVRSELLSNGQLVVRERFDGVIYGEGEALSLADFPEVVRDPDFFPELSQQPLKICKCACGTGLNS